LYTKSANFSAEVLQKQPKNPPPVKRKFYPPMKKWQNLGRW